MSPFVALFVAFCCPTLLMEEFYANLWHKKLSKLEALRQAQLTVLKNPARVEQRRKELRAQLKDRAPGLKAMPLPDGGQIANRCPPALGAAFILSGDVR
jgi:CHAT domain-containing protein